MTRSSFKQQAIKLFKQQEVLIIIIDSAQIDSTAQRDMILQESIASCEAFVSAPIKLAAKMAERRRGYRSNQTMTLTHDSQDRTTKANETSRSRQGNQKRLSLERTNQQQQQQQLPTSAAWKWHNRLLSTTSRLLLLSLLLNNNHQSFSTSNSVLAQSIGFSNQQLVNTLNGRVGSAANGVAPSMRHHAHYLSFVPSAHFSYNEGRQLVGRSLGGSQESESLGSIESVPAVDELNLDSVQSAGSSHIYKRSSAALVMAPASVSVSSTSGRAQHQPLIGSAPLNPLISRRMMAPNGNNQVELATTQVSGSRQAVGNWFGVAGTEQEQQSNQDSPQVQFQVHSDAVASSASLSGSSLSNNHKKQSEHEEELLRQKQHIQYHDQWPSMAGKCHKRTLNFCASVLPFNTTTFPNIIGDTNRFEVKRSLPFFGFLAKSSCNKRLDELLCLLLEPPCYANSGVAIPPCKKFCRLALEGCNEYIPATLALSSVFDCRQYPDSNDPSVCVNLAQGSKCGQDEFKCPDKTCIPRKLILVCLFSCFKHKLIDSACLSL